MKYEYKAKRDVTAGGVRIPAGTKVSVETDADVAPSHLAAQLATNAFEGRRVDDSAAPVQRTASETTKEPTGPPRK